LLALIVLGLACALVRAEPTKVKHVGIFTKPVPAAPSGWRRSVSSSYAETLDYYWTAKDAHKSDMTLQMHFYQHAWNPAYHRPEFFKKKTFETAGRKRLADLDKKANEKKRYPPNAKTEYLTGDSTVGPWKMRTYVLRYMRTASAYPKRLVWVVLYQPGKDAWVEIGINGTYPSFPANATAEWFAASEIQAAADNQWRYSFSPKTWTPAKSPRWKDILKLARKKGAEKQAKLGGDQKKMLAGYNQGQALFMKTLGAFFRSQSIDATLDPSYFRNPDPSRLMRWYQWPKPISEPVMASSPLAKPAGPGPPPTAPDEKKPPSTDKPSPKKDFQAELKAARALLDAEKWSETIKACRRVLAVDPKNPTALWYRGLAFAGRKRYRLAAEQFQAVAELKPGNKEIANYVASVKKLADKQEAACKALLAQTAKAVDAKDFQAALASSNKALEIHPASNVARWYKGIALVGLKRYAEAFEALDAVARAQPGNKNLRTYADKVGEMARKQK